jgi:lipopolysaccharide biosynthesis glycosyltransferase
MSAHRIFLGWDAREATAYAVAARSIRARASQPVDIQPISMGPLRDNGWYHRPTEIRDGRLFDVLSDSFMSTEHAIARFFVPQLCEFRGWALFADCDILCRADIADLFALADTRYAVQCVHHHYDKPTELQKMDGQLQVGYPKKLWSSVMLWNCDHPAHRALTLNHLNTWPGRDLHGFRWLWEEQIGSLPPDWNYCVYVSPRIADPSIVHFTLGTPDMRGYEDSEFADEWRAYLRAAVA